MSSQAEQRPYFPFYRSFRDAIAELPQETKLPIYEAIANYALDGVEPNSEVLGVIGGAMWKLILPNLVVSRQKYNNGCKGGCPKGTTKPSMRGNQNATKPKQNQNETKTKTINREIDNREIDNREIDNREIDNNGATPKPQTAKRFSPPSIVEVDSYIKEMGYANVDAQQFCDYYNSIGWMVGKSPMKDWRSAVRNWERRAKTNNPLKNEKYNESFRGNQKSNLLHFEAGGYGESTI